MRITYAYLIEKRDDAHREASDLRARVTELESKVNAPSIPASELAEAVRERDAYWVLHSRSRLKFKARRMDMLTSSAVLNPVSSPFVVGADLFIASSNILLFLSNSIVFSLVKLCTFSLNRLSKYYHRDHTCIASLSFFLSPTDCTSSQLDPREVYDRIA